MRQVILIDCVAGNADHAEGVPIAIVTIAHGMEIEPMMFMLHDTKTLVAKLLVALASLDDEFAQDVLEAHFPADEEGYYHWPSASNDR